MKDLKSNLAKELVNHLKSCATALVKPSTDTEEAGADAKAPSEGSITTVVQSEVDKSGLGLENQSAIALKEHLEFEICRPTTTIQAHHIRYAQAKGLGLKVE